MTVLVHRRVFTRLLPLVCALLVAMLAPSAWGLNASAATPPPTANVRVVHASLDAPAVDVYVDGAKAFSNLAFMAVTDYASLPAGSHHVQVFAAGTGPSGKAVIDAAVTLKAGTDYTVAAIGLLATIKPLVLVDDNSLPPPGASRLRAVHASTDAPAVDLAVTGGPTVIKGLAFGSASDFLTVKPGALPLNVLAAGTSTVALGLPDFRIHPGRTFTVFVVGTLKGGLQVIVAKDRGPQARIRVAHASPDAPAVDVYLDGAAAITNLSFKTVTPYLTVPAGSHHVQVFASGTGPSGKAVIDTTVFLKNAWDYTVVAANKLANITAFVLHDNNPPPPSGKAEVRVVHASPDTPAVDVAVTGGAVLSSGLQPNAASDYLTVPAGTYNLEVRAAGTTTAALKLPGVTLAAGKIYTVYAEGLLSGMPALSTITSVDN